MNPSTRWTLLVLAVVVIGLLLLWMRRDQPGEIGVAKEPAAPVAAPKAEPVARAETKPETPAAPAPPLTAAVLFDFDRATLRPGETAKLDALAEQIKGKTFDRAEAVGYADRIGAEPYNLRLSERRAEAVRGYLAGKGLDAGRIHVEGRGEKASVTGDACRNMGLERPANQKLLQCLQPDRRVAIEVIGIR
jgi:OOP family OmpA-OmpF porin